MPSRLEFLFVSPGHNFFGHHGQKADAHPAVRVTELRCVAGRGIAGDRFFDYRPDYAGQITFFSMEVLERLQEELALATALPEATRRNVFVRGIALETLYGRDFCLQGVWFQGFGECKPCYWMDKAIGLGTEAWLRGRGGMRARILSGGALHEGEGHLQFRSAEPEPLDLATAASGNHETDSSQA